MMKKKSLIAFIAVIVILVIWCVTQYNGIITKEESVSTAWGNVEVQYQRRADLIPNLVNTVKGYATHEQETLNGVVAARAKATQITVDPDFRKTGCLSKGSRRRYYSPRQVTCHNRELSAA